MTRPLPSATVLADRYELGELLGSGGMAQVHLAHDRLLGRTVAVKLLLPERRSGPDAGGDARRLQDEARAAAAIHHPAAVAVHDVGTSGEGVFVVMEHLVGRTWREELREHGRLGEARVLPAAASVCDALAAAHDLGIVHRDVNPGNVMLCRDGTPKLMDFGIARVAAGARRTATGVVIGTAGYLSPEQARGDVLDGRSDVYSLGCTLYELLSGGLPFSGPSTVEVASQRLHDRAPRLRGYSPAATDAVARALARDPADRPTAAELAAMLRAACVPAPRPPEEPVTTRIEGDDEPGDDLDRPPSADDPEPAPRMRRAGVVLVSLGLAAVLVAALVLALVTVS